jgi:hypothetical protein
MHNSAMHGTNIKKCRDVFSLLKNVFDSETRDPKLIYNRWHFVSVAFFMLVVGVMLAESAD